MTYCSTPFPMTLSDLQGHSPIASLFTCDFLYNCAAVDKISTDTRRRAVSLLHVSLLLCRRYWSTNWMEWRSTAIKSTAQHTREQFLELGVSLGLGFVLVSLFGFSIFCVFCFRLDSNLKKKNADFLFWCFYFYCVRFSFFTTKPRDWLGRTSLKWPVLCQVGRKSKTLS